MGYVFNQGFCIVMIFGSYEVINTVTFIILRMLLHENIIFDLSDGRGKIKG